MAEQKNSTQICKKGDADLQYPLYLDLYLIETLSFHKMEKVAMVQALIVYGADVNYHVTGSLPRHIAAKENNGRLVLLTECITFNKAACDAMH